VPYYQRNVDNDKVIFYHSGEFMSRRGVGAGSITEHPQGIDHEPGTAKQRDWSNEVAILIETEELLELTEVTARVEDPEYVRSWMS
jgi:homogentisate 1,2-dioxygenase